MILGPSASRMSHTRSTTSKGMLYEKSVMNQWVAYSSGVMGCSCDRRCAERRGQCLRSRAENWKKHWNSSGKPGDHMPLRRQLSPHAMQCGIQNAPSSLMNSRSRPAGKPTPWSHTAHNRQGEQHSTEAKAKR